jgi:hypothetical protein
LKAWFPVLCVCGVAAVLSLLSLLAWLLLPLGLSARVKQPHTMLICLPPLFSIV